MTSKAEEAYVPVIRKYRELGLEMRRRKLVTDFEIALINAFRRVYGPQLSISGCLFHYVVDVNEAVGRLQLTDFIANSHEAQKCLRRLLAFPRLDHQSMAAGIQAIIDVRAGVYGELYVLIMYHHNFWIKVVRPRRLSVYEQYHATSNSVEVHHTSVGRNTYAVVPNLWDVSGECYFLTTYLRTVRNRIESGWSNSYDSKKQLFRISNFSNFGSTPHCKLPVKNDLSMRCIFDIDQFVNI